MSRKQNETAYLFMVSYIANTPLNEICVLDEDSPEAMAAAYRKSKKKETFGFDVHGNDEEFDAEEMTPSETEQARIKADKSIEKDVGLRHTEEVLWQNMLRIHSKNLADNTPILTRSSITTPWERFYSSACRMPWSQWRSYLPF
jgi:hypothetical protein